LSARPAPVPPTVSAPLHFTGKPRDTETGLDDFGARSYSSTLGRWLTPDWAAQAEPAPYAQLDNPQSLNLYTYVLNNPVSHVDRDGHCSDGISCGAELGATFGTFIEPVGGTAVGATVGIAVDTVVDLGMGGYLLYRHFRSGQSGRQENGPKINDQKQDGHVKDTPQFKNRVKQGKPTSSFDSREQADHLTKDTYKTGKPVPGRPNQVVKDYGTPVGTGPNGGTQSQINGSA